MPIEELAVLFQQSLRDYPIVLLLDGLDKLPKADRIDLQFLRRRCYLHDHSVVLVSCQSDVFDYEEKRWTCYFGPHTCILNENANIKCYNLDLEPVNFLGNIVIKTLERKCRRLTQQQLTVVCSILNEVTLPLFAELVCKVCEKWTSSDTDVSLTSELGNLVNVIMDAVERSYGSILVKFAVGFITFSQSGIGNIEMEDLLSLSEEVMDSINQYNVAERLPSHVWLRVRSEICDLLTNQKELLTWQHALVRYHIQQRYSQEDITRLHDIMGRYFGDLVDSDIVLKQGIRKQPLVLSSSNPGSCESVWDPLTTINHRRCEEAGNSLIRANRLQQAFHEICTLNAACAYTRCRCNDIYLKNLRNLMDALENAESVQVAGAFFNWYRKNSLLFGEVPMSDILRTAAKEPFLVPLVSQVVTTYYRMGYSEESYTTMSSTNDIGIGSIDAESNCTNIFKGENGFLALDYSAKEDLIAALQFIPATVWVWKLSTGELYSKITHFPSVTPFNPVLGISLHPLLPQLVVPVGDTCQVRDLLAGKVLTELQVPTTSDDFMIHAMLLSVDGNFVITATKDEVHFRTVGLDFVFCRGHTAPVTCLAASENGEWIAAGLANGTVYLWPIGGAPKLLVVDSITDGAISCLCFDSTSATLLVASRDSVVSVWSREESKLSSQMKMDVPLCCASSGFAFFICADQSGAILAIRYFDWAISLCLRVDEAVVDLQVRSDRECMCGVTNAGSFLVWKMIEGPSEISFEVLSRTALSGCFLFGVCRFALCSPVVWCAAVYPDEARPHTEFNLLQLWNFNCDTKELREVHGYSHKEAVAATFDLTCTLLFLGTKRNRIAVLQLSNRQWLNPIPDLSHGICCCTYSKSGRFLVWGTKGHVVVVDLNEQAVAGEKAFAVMNSHNKCNKAINKVVIDDKEILGAGCSENGGCCLFELGGGGISHVFEENTSMMALNFNHQGSILAGASTWGWVYLWDVEAKTELGRFLPDNASNLISKTPATGVCFSRDDQRLYTSCFNKLQCWSVFGDLQESQVAHANTITGISIITVGSKELILSSSSDCTVKLWDGIMNISLEPNTVAKQVSVVCYHPFLDFIAIAGVNCVQVWDINVGNVVLHHAFKFNEFLPARVVAFSPCGEELLCIALDHLFIWSWRTKERKRAYNINAVSVSMFLDYSSSNRHCAVCCHDRSIKFIRNDRITLKLQQDSDSSVSCIQLCPRDRFLAALRWNCQEVLIWNVADLIANEIPIENETIEGVKLTPSVKLEFENDNSILHMAFNWSGDRLATSKRGQLTLWDPRSGEKMYAIFTGMGMVSSLCFTPDDKRLITGYQNLVKLYCVDDEHFHKPDILNHSVNLGRESGILDGQMHTIKGVAIKPNGTAVAAISVDDTFRIWFSSLVRNCD